MASLAASAVQQQKHAFLRAWLCSFDREHLFSIFESNAFALEDLDDPDTSASDFFEAICDCDADTANAGGGLLKGGDKFKLKKAIAKLKTIFDAGPAAVAALKAELGLGGLAPDPPVEAGAVQVRGLDFTPVDGGGKEGTAMERAFLGGGFFGKTYLVTHQLDGTFTQEREEACLLCVRVLRDVCVCAVYMYTVRCVMCAICVCVLCTVRMCGELLRALCV